MDEGLEGLQKLVEFEMGKSYSKTAIDHAMQPRNVGVLPGADGYAEILGPCGDTMEIWISVNNGIIEEATFMTDGCGTSIAAGSMATEMIKGKALEDALQIGQQDILDALDGLPEESQHCALLAANTLKEAIANYFEYSREKWKRNYKKQW